MTELFPVVLRKEPGGHCAVVDRRKAAKRQWETKWLPNGEPIPEGWSLVNEAPSHHAHYSRLISREVT